MKKIVFISFFLLFVSGLIFAEENAKNPTYAAKISRNNLFDSVTMRKQKSDNSTVPTALSNEEMKNIDGEMGIIAGIISAVTLGSMYYKAATGRDFLKDVHRHVVRPISRGIRNARDYDWRKRTYGGSW